MFVEALGRLFDVGLGFAPVDTQAGANTGKRFSLQNAGGITFLLVKGAGSGTDDPVFTLKQHTAASGGTTSNLAAITRVFTKSEATLDNDESWTLATQAAAATYTGTGLAQLQALVAIDVGADQLSDGYTHVSLDVADTGSAGAQLGTIIGIVHDLHEQRAVTLLGSLLSPGTANV